MVWTKVEIAELVKRDQILYIDIKIYIYIYIHIWKVQLAGYAIELHVRCERKRRIKDKSNIFRPEQLKGWG